MSGTEMVSENLWKVGVGVCTQVQLPALNGGSTASSPMGCTMELAHMDVEIHANCCCVYTQINKWNM